MDFAVVDVETTGFSPRNSDRVIEVAIVRVDTRGKVLDKFATLVNPHRDVGPCHIHGLTARDVVEAPPFEDIAGHLVPLLRGAVFTAHNVYFDKRFIEAEFSRMNSPLPPIPLLCTLRLSRLTHRVFRHRRLADLCEAFDVPFEHEHSAMSDASAAAKLLKCMFDEIGIPRNSEVLKDIIATSDTMQGDSAWPTIPPRSVPFPRNRKCTSQSDHSLIGALIAKLPPSTDASIEASQYLNLLDRVLEDRIVTEGEVQALTELATDLRISQPQIRRLHEEYVDSLIALALRDNTVSIAEGRDLEDVAALLGIGGSKLERMIEEGKQRRANPEQRQARSTIVKEIAGKTICFTGESNCMFDGKPISRTLLERAAEIRGLIPRNSVTKKLDFLVASDTHSMSGKATKAKRYGTRILAEAVFWQMVDIDPSDERAIRGLDQNKV